jgi:hypothetical protein
LKGEVIAPQTVNAAKEELAAVKEDEAAVTTESPTLIAERILYNTLKSLVALPGGSSG